MHCGAAPTWLLFAPVTALRGRQPGVAARARPFPQHDRTNMSQDASAQQTLTADHRDAEPSRNLFAIVGAELFGSFLLVFVGVGIALYASLHGAGALGVALGSGVAFMAAAAAIGSVSGGHLTPALTLGSAIAGRTPWAHVPAYWLAQVVGAVAAAAALFTTIPKNLVEGQSATFDGLNDFFSTTANGFEEHSGAFRSASEAFFAPYFA